MGQEEYQELSSFLKRFSRRFKLLQGIEGICLTAICAVLLFAAGLGIYQLRQLLPYAPLVYSILTGIVLLAAIGWTAFRFLGRLSQERAALFIEQQQPKLRNNLINSLQLYPQVAEAKNTPGFSATMVFALLRATRKQVAALKIDELLDHSRIRSSARLLAFLILPVLAMVFLNPSWVGGTLNMLANPLDHLPPSQTTIEVEPKGMRVVRGSPVTIQAATGRCAAAVCGIDHLARHQCQRRAHRPGKDRHGKSRRRQVQLEQIARLDKTLRYRVVTGAFTSATFTAEAVDTPEIANIQLMLYPPAYTGLASTTSPEGSIEGLKGSSLRLDAVTTKDVVKAEIVMDDGKKIPLKIDGRKLQANLVLFQSQSYRIRGRR